MTTSITKADLVSLHDAIRAEMRQDTKDLISDQRESLQPLKSGLDGLRDQMRDVHTKLDAIMSGDVLVTRHQLLRLIEKLKAQGFTVDEKELFAA